MTVKTFLVQVLVVLFILVIGVLIWNFATNFQARP
jgi:regulatory protein YycH of two-component signal transduction system YycFG